MSTLIVHKDDVIRGSEVREHARLKISPVRATCNCRFSMMITAKLYRSPCLHSNRHTPALRVSDARQAESAPPLSLLRISTTRRWTMIVCVYHMLHHYGTFHLEARLSPCGWSERNSIDRKTVNQFLGTALIHQLTLSHAEVLSSAMQKLTRHRCALKVIGAQRDSWAAQINGHASHTACVSSTLR